MGQARSGELCHVQLPQQDRPGFIQPGNDRGVVFRNEIVEHRGAAGGADPLGVNLVLYGVGDSVERTPVLPLGDFPLGCPCRLQRLVAEDGEVCSDLAVLGVDAVKVGFRGLDRRDLPGPEQVGKLGNAQKRNPGFIHPIHSLRPFRRRRASPKFSGQAGP